MPNLIPIDLKREYKRLCENIDDEEPSTFGIERSEQYGDIMIKSNKKGGGADEVEE